MPPKGKKRKAEKRKAEEKYTLVYFDIDGLAETSRLLFAAADTEFEDKRYKFEMKEGKAIHPEWDVDKEKYAFHKVPVLYVDETEIPQSRAIESFLAKKFSLAGKTHLEAALIDAIAEQCRDIRTAMRDAKNKGDDELKKFWSEVLPKQFSLLEKWLTDHKTEYFVGKKPTYADIAVFRLVTDWADNKTDVDKALQGNPRLIKTVGLVREIDGIKKYLDKKNKPKEAETTPTTKSSS